MGLEAGGLGLYISDGLVVGNFRTLFPGPFQLLVSRNTVNCARKRETFVLDLNFKMEENKTRG
jgi:hypothetical protein